MFQLKVAAYNIHGCIGVDGVLDLPRVARVLRIGVPDVIGLNEVYRFMSGAAQDEEIARELGESWTAVFGKTITKSLADYGNAILTKLPVVSSENWLLDEFAGQERRGLMRVSVRQGDRLIHVFCTHLGLKGMMRSKSATQILEIMDRFRDGDRVLLGDLNDTVPAAGLEILEKAGFVDAWANFGLSAGKTFPSRMPLRRLDYVWMDKGLAAESCYVGVYADARVASDHRPVFASVITEDDLTKREADAASASAGVLDDFQKIEGGDTPRWWRRIGARLIGDSESGGFGGIAIAGEEHFWRQKCGGDLIYERKIQAPGQSDRIAIGVRLCTVTPGAAWTLGLGSGSVRMRHEAGAEPALEMVYGDGEIIASASLTAAGIDPYTWNNYVLDVGDQVRVMINEKEILRGERRPDDRHSGRGLWIRTDGTGAGPCEIFADDFIVSCGGAGELVKFLPPRLIRRGGKEKTWWLDLW